MCSAYKNNELELPNWLDHYIFEELKAQYGPFRTNMEVIDWGKEQVLRYLGTYFPRSYTEAYCITRKFLNTHDSFSEKEDISIFDFGCGTGGETLGLITALIEKYPNLKTLTIVGLDGNNCSLYFFESIIDRYSQKYPSIDIKCKVSPIKIDDLYDLSILDDLLKDKFDIIISFKAICEFISKQRFEECNAYESLIKFMHPRLKDGGGILLADITSYDNVGKDWLPKIMDKGISQSGCECIASNKGYNESFEVTHSRKTHDVSRIAWRIIK